MTCALIVSRAAAWSQAKRSPQNRIQTQPFKNFAFPVPFNSAVI